MSHFFTHIAFNDALVYENHNYPITCLDCYGKSLVVGTNQGHLLVYEFIPNKTGFKTELKDLKGEFAKKKKIDQIKVLESYQMMIMLSDGVITIHSLPSFRQVMTLSNYPKPAVSFTADTTGNRLRLAIVTKKKTIVICEYAGDEFVLRKELSVPEIVKPCLWCGNSLCVGMKKEYNLIDINTGSMSDLFKSDHSILAGTNLPSLDNNMLLCKKSMVQNISVFIGMDGKPTKNYGLLWSESPIELDCVYPYAIALLPKSVEIHLLFGNLSQQISIAGATCMSVSSDGVIYVASTTKSSSIWRLSPVDFGEQVDNLSKNGKLTEALLLLDNLDDTQITGRAKKIENTKLSSAYQAFTLGNYGRAMTDFVMLKIDPLQVISLYANFLPLCLRNQYKSPIKIEEGNSQIWTYQPLIPYLELKRKEDQEKRALSQGIKQEELQGYDPLEWAATTDPRQIIDTTLLRCYEKTSSGKTSSAETQNLLSLPNYCHTKESESILLLSRRYADLVVLYRSRGLHVQALALLQKLGRDPQSDMPGTKFSIDYLKALGKENLNILLDPEKILWILQDNRQQGIEIYTATRLPGHELPPAEVLTFLEEYSIEKKTQTISKILVMAYLEFIITELAEKNPEFHHKLAVHYFELVIDMKRKIVDPNINKMVAGMEPGNLGYIRTKLLNFLEDSNYYMPAKLLSRYNYTSEGLREERAILLSKVGKHLEALREYVHELDDFDIAEKYCNKHYDPDKEEFRDVYLNLLEVYLTVPPNCSERFAKKLDTAAYALLKAHHKEIDIPKALKIIPENTPLEKLYSYFEYVICDINKERRNKQIQMNLQGAERMKVQSELLKLHSNIVKITDDQYCPVCNEKINLMIFSRFPDGTIKHYKCFHKESLNQRKG